MPPGRHRHDKMLVDMNLLHPSSCAAPARSIAIYMGRCFLYFASETKQIRVAMEMEKIMGCQIPAFGMWNYCHDLSITQYFDSAMQARLMKRWNHRDHGGEKKGAAVAGAGEHQLALFRSYSLQRKPAQTIKVIRREAGKHCNGGELPQDGGVQAEAGACFSSRKEVGACAVKRTVVSRAVDEDLYKVPQPLLYQKPKKMRKVVWSMWIGCLGLDCIA